MKPESAHPIDQNPGGKLSGKVALINDTHTELGWAVANLFAHEGADVVLSCAEEEQRRTRKAISQEEKKCLIMSGDAADISYCIDAVERTLNEYGGLDILVNNTAGLGIAPSCITVSGSKLEHRISNSVASTLLMTQSALFYLSEGAIIINTIPIQFEASSGANYLAAKLSLTSFTRTLAKELAPRQIRVNAVGLTGTDGASQEQTAAERGSRQSQPVEIAPSYLFLASHDSAQMTGQILFPN